MQAKEIFKQLCKKEGKPERILKQYEAFSFVWGDPVSAYLMEGFAPGAVYKDKWGVTIQYPLGAPGPMPYITEETKVLKDITHWKDIVKAPDISIPAKNDWSIALNMKEAIHYSDKLSMCLMGTGIFEQCHYLMGFEDTLTNLYEHPKEMHELIDYILEYRLQYAKQLIEHIHPDAILSHDDWGSKDSLFMNEQQWREFFKEPYRKFYGYIKSQGVYILHHADSYCAPIIKDMAEIGIDCWQGVLPENNIPKLLEQLDGDMVLMGGVGAVIDRKDATEEEIRIHVSNVLQQCCPLGHFIPCITYGLPGTVYKHVDPIIDDEIDQYNNIAHFPKYYQQSNIRRVIKEAASVTESSIQIKEETTTLAQLSKALRNGQKKKVLDYTKKALNEKCEPLDILNEGLIQGMNILGKDFSENKAFIPEMLMAAKCMSAAMEILKPYLSSESQAKGKVCIGTVKGDMHDIGKNLVKIMMESSGIEVIDLGTDVDCETFINTTIQQHCDIICCSALLTTTMENMRQVVNLCKEKGIRDQVKIMIGGAPISQSFCDEIGADIYTDDAALAAQAALQLLKEKYG